MIPMKTTYSSSELADEIMRFHGFSNKIVSDKDARFTSKFWKEMFAGLVIKLAFSMTYHPQTDGQKERLT